MPVKLNPTSQIKARLGIDPNGRVQQFFTNTCYKHMDKYVPMDQGDLRTIVDIQEVVDIQPNSITYEMPYARYQYYGVREDGTHPVRNYSTPGTGTYWDRRMVSAEMNDLLEEVQDYIGGK